MGMHHGIDVRPGSQDASMNEALQVERTFLVFHRLPAHVELDDVLLLDQLRRQRARDEEGLRILGIADADMAIGVDHVLLGEDTVGDDEVFDDGIEIGHFVLVSLYTHPGLYTYRTCRGA